MNILLLEDFVLVASLSLVGGIGGYLQGVRTEKIKSSWINFFTDLTLAVSLGLAIAYIGHARSWNPALVCALALLCGNNAAELFDLINQLKKEFLLKKIKKDNNDL